MNLNTIVHLFLFFLAINFQTFSKEAPLKIDLKNANFLTMKDFVALESFKDEEVVHYEGIENIAIIEGTEFKDGIIEFEMASLGSKRSGTPGGIAFRCTDKYHYECIFFTPNNPSIVKKNDDAIRYTARTGDKRDSARGPAHYKVLRDFVYKYNAPSDGVVFEDWFKVKLIIRGKQVKVFINDKKEPDLVIHDLMGKKESGNIALWGYNTYYKNLSITSLN